MPDDDEEVEGLGFGEEGPDAKNRLKHPVVVFFHICFRAAAILLYMFGGIFSFGFVPTFVTVVILLSLDFWVVKNITGRLLVGLRWWNYVDDQGQSHWVFESRKGARAGGRPRERRIFWTSLFVTPIIWILFLFTSVFTFGFRWAILVILAIGLNGANLYGYIRCSLGHTPGLSDANGLLGQGFASMMFRQAAAAASNIASSASGKNTGSGDVANAFTQQV